MLIRFWISIRMESSLQQALVKEPKTNEKQSNVFHKKLCQHRRRSSDWYNGDDDTVTARLENLADFSEFYGRWERAHGRNFEFHGRCKRPCQATGEMPNLTGNRSRESTGALTQTCAINGSISFMNNETNWTTKCVKY